VSLTKAHPVGLHMAYCSSLYARSPCGNSVSCL